MTQGNGASSVKRGGRKLRNDLILIAALLIAVSLVGVCVYLFRADGDSVEVRVDGELYGTYSLEKDITVEIRTGEDDAHVNVLVIKDGRASVVRADCPDGICVSHRAISRKGESIVCLPHKVTVTVVGDKSDAPDVIV